MINFSTKLREDEKMRISPTNNDNKCKTFETTIKQGHHFCLLGGRKVFEFGFDYVLRAYWRLDV